jgi:alpha 1,3-glucosidase
MQLDLARTGRHMVTIVDPHVKRDDNYFVHSEASSLGYYVKDGNNDFDGWCWSGSSSYPDFTSSKVREWWGGFYSKYTGSTNYLSTWIDMNEPSVFNGPEVTMKKTLTNLNNIEHREWHNLYGFHYHQATFEGIKKAHSNEELRPFVLTRSFFAGTQRYGAIWNGDNKADWTHLQITAPMLLSMSIVGLPFIGGDVGGFFGNPDTELLIRWYESGSMQPFFRAHAHIETKRREPWLFGEVVLNQIRSIVIERYRILSYIYTCFQLASKTGLPVMRPIFSKLTGQALENGWTLGQDLLILPILEPGLTKLIITDEIEDEIFLEFSTGINVKIGIQFPAPLGKSLVFYRLGSIVPKQMRVRRSSELMKQDPYTLWVTLNSLGKATGSLYLDDQVSYKYISQLEYVMIHLHVDDCKNSGNTKGCKLTSKIQGKYPNKVNVIERVVFSASETCDLNTSVVGKAIQMGKETSFEVICEGNNLVWRKPWVKITEPFELILI